MRLDSLTHKKLPADSILKEIGVPSLAYNNLK